ncbi:hypothetical protein KC878_03420 [Candidatus Saccharibacteria bacterium]|nr:hypothetical protein [Candidatus Saccharibacteria bacterium]MCB9820976.1 hypothetical protein [Candidatus Nomurabacteria bacterium]
MKSVNFDAKKFFYILIGLLVLGGIATGYGLAWANKQLADRAQKISLLNLQADELDKKIINAHKLQAELSSNQDLLTTASEVLPRTKNPENIVGELISIAAKLGIELESINFVGGSTSANSPISQSDKVDDIPGVYSIGISTGFSTSYEKLLKLLEDLENNKRRFEITDIDITPIENDSGAIASYVTQLTILTYVRP